MKKGLTTTYEKKEFICYFEYLEELWFKWGFSQK